MKVFGRIRERIHERDKSVNEGGSTEMKERVLMSV